MTDATSGLRVGLAGLGKQGQGFLNFLQRFDHEVVGADISQDTREQTAAEYDIEVIENPRDLIDLGLDCLIVAVPTKYHESLVVPALNAGMDTLVEKPVGHTLESTRQIADANDANDAFCMVGYHNRFLRSVELLKGYIDDDYFGRLDHIQAAFERRRGVPGRGSWFTSKDIGGGGALMDIGVHVIDLLLYFFGYPDVAKVWGRTRQTFGDKSDYSYLFMYGEEGRADLFDVEDGISFWIEFADGRTASVEIAWAMNNSAQHRYRLLGTEAGALLDLTDTYWVDREGTGITARDDLRSSERLRLYEVRDCGGDHFVNSEVVAEPKDANYDLLQTFFESVVSGREPAINTVGQATRVQEIVDAIYQSDRTGNVVTPD